MSHSGNGGFTKKGSNGNLKKKKKAGGVTVAKKVPPAALKKAPSGKITPTNVPNASTTSGLVPHAASVDKCDESVDDNSTDEDYSDDGDEGADGYKPGGYHPVNIGDKFNARYTVIEKLGWGHFSTVWMCYDKKSAQNSTPEFIAMKVQKSAPHYREAAIDEIELLNCASKASLSEKVLAEFGPSYDPCVVLLLNNFDHQGPNGRHVCMCFEMLGENLLKVIKRYDYRGIPIPIVKSFVKQICVGLDFLHRQCSIIHTDLKPENILIARPPPIPHPERVKKILGESSDGQGGGNKKAAKNKKKKKKKQNADVNISIEALQKELENSGKAMTAEERKRLKKKLKKKKQQARKKNERRKRRGKPRNVRKSTSPSDRDKDKDREKATIAAEEMMMERDSLPMALKKDKDIDQAGGAADTHADAKGTDRVASSSSKAMIPANASSTSLGASVSTYSQFADDIDDVDDNDDDADDDVGYASLERDFQRGEIQLGVKSSAGRSAELVADCQSFACWQRPTLFTFMNFTSEIPEPSPKVGPSSTGAGSAGSSLAKLTLMKKESCKLPVGRDYARISLLAPACRLVDIFGEPVEFNETLLEEDREHNADSDGDVETLLFAQWCFSFAATRDDLTVASPSKAKASAAASSSSAAGSEQVHFCVKGCGEDTTGISALAGFCILNALAQQPDIYSVRKPAQKLERPVLWHIEHSAHHTEALISYLEKALPGVYFMGHYDMTSVITEEDDADLLYISRSLCLHPAAGTGMEEDKDYDLESLEKQLKKAEISDDLEDEVDSEGQRSESKRDGPSSHGNGNGNDDSRISNAPISGGSLIGIDLDSLARLVVITDLDLDGDGLGRAFFNDPRDLCEYVKPLSKRLKTFYMTDGDDIETFAEEFLFAVSEAADAEASGMHKDSLGFVSEVEREAEVKQRAALAAQLEAEYASVRVKIVDLGNACWTYKHFTDDIQTRQYRAPEVILGAGYDTSADIWSLACIVFEQVTGDLLFDPQEGKSWDREEDHLAMMIELLGDFPKNITSNGRYAGEFFNRKGELRHIHSLKYWGLADVLMDKYKVPAEDAKALSDFMQPLLEVDPKKRATAADALRHPWIRDVPIPPISSESKYSVLTADDRADAKDTGASSSSQSKSHKSYANGSHDSAKAPCVSWGEDKGAFLDADHRTHSGMKSTDTKDVY